MGLRAEKAQLEDKCFYQDFEIALTQTNIGWIDQVSESCLVPRPQYFVAAIHFGITWSRGEKCPLGRSFGIRHQNQLAVMIKACEKAGQELDSV